MKQNQGKCKYCGREVKGRALGGHVVCCEKYPGRASKIEKQRLLSTGKKHSFETKRKISEIRRRYLEKHPEMVPYRLGHSSKESFPERMFREALDRAGIKNYVQYYQFSIYQFDFAFLEKKIDVEIDGRTHLSDNVKMIDKRRDDFSKANGWSVLRFTSDDVRKNSDECVSELLHSSNW